MKENRKKHKKYYINSTLDKDTSEIKKNIRIVCEKHELEETFDISFADLIISIGGDGTFLKSAKLNLNAEIFGINKGTLGYLTEIEENNLETAIQNYVLKNYIIQKRMLLTCNFKKDNKLKTESALNDVVISKDDSSILGLDIYIDDILVNSYYADGIIISTPTGSTGYSLSCGGPIIDPTSEMIIITPIAPHTMINRSIVVSKNSNIRIHLINTKDSNHAKLAIDGQSYSILEGTFISIEKSDKVMNLVTFNKNNFLDKIKQKMS